MTFSDDVAKRCERLNDDRKECITNISIMGGYITSMAGFKTVADEILNLPVVQNVGTLVDNSVAFRKSVPLRSVSHCYLNSIGGMTYKGFTFDCVVEEFGGGYSAPYSFTFPKAFTFPTDDLYAFAPIVCGRTDAPIGDASGFYTLSGTTITGRGYMNVTDIPAGTVLRCIPRFENQDFGGYWFPPDCFPDLRDAKPTAVKSYGKNFAFPSESEYQDYNGLTCVVNEGISVTINGTATAQVKFYFFQNKTLSAGSYFFSAEGLEKATGTAIIVLRKTPKGGVGAENVVTLSKNTISATCTITEEDAKAYVYKLDFTAYKGASLNNVTIYPIMSNRAPITYTLPTAITDKLGSGVEGYADTADFANGLFITEMATVVFNGTEDWSLNDNATASGFHFAPPKRPFFIEGGVNAICSHCELWKLHYSTGMPLWTFKIGDSALSGTRAWMKTYDPTGASGFATVDAWKAYLADQYAKGTPVTITYITIDGSKSTLTTDFNPLIPVEAGGYLEFVNEYGYAVPSTVTFQIVK